MAVKAVLTAFSAGVAIQRQQKFKVAKHSKYACHNIKVISVKEFTILLVFLPVFCVAAPVT